VRSAPCPHRAFDPRCWSKQLSCRMCGNTLNNFVIN
jgi:hypothetical protein